MPSPFAPELATTRLALRAIAPTDAPALAAALWHDRDHLSPWIAVPRREPSLAWMRARIDALAAAFASGDRMLYTIRAHGDAALLGCVGLKPRTTAAYAVSYWLCASYTHRGYACEAAAAMCEAAFAQGGAERVLLECHPDNVRSARVARRLGFVETARRSTVQEWTLTTNRRTEHG